MKLTAETYKQQVNLANYCRNGDLPKIEATIPKNLPQYRRLVFNIISDALETTYPISAKKLGIDAWEELVDDFFTNYPCSSVQIWSMPHELITYLESTNHKAQMQFPWLLELLHFEWLEVSVFCAEDEHVDFLPSTNALNEIIVLNPTLHLEHFTFPVHKSIQLNKQDHYYLLVYRSTKDNKVYFEEITGFLALIIHQIANSESTLEKILLELSSKQGVLDKKTLLEEGNLFAEKMMHKTVFLGKRIEQLKE